MLPNERKEITSSLFTLAKQRGWDGKESASFFPAVFDPELARAIWGKNWKNNQGLALDLIQEYSEDEALKLSLFYALDTSN